jgi:hypothetical protein
MDVMNLKRQHKDVMNLADYILDNIKKHTVEQNLNVIAKSINIISGKLKIHLLNEDKNLYPYLMSSSDAKLNEFGKKYYEEMNDVTREYEDYKFKYNTANKIKDNVGEFEETTKQIFSIMSNRIDREEKELYPLLS